MISNYDINQGEVPEPEAPEIPWEGGGGGGREVKTMNSFEIIIFMMKQVVRNNKLNWQII